MENREKHNGRVHLLPNGEAGRNEIGKWICCRNKGTEIETNHRSDANEEVETVLRHQRLVVVHELRGKRQAKHRDNTGEEVETVSRRRYITQSKIRGGSRCVDKQKG